MINRVERLAEGAALGDARSLTIRELRSGRAA